MKNVALIVFCGCFFACADNLKPVGMNNPNKQDFFPVVPFIKGQIHQIDSQKLPTRKYSALDGKTDSMLISMDEFDSIAKGFLEPDINSPAIKIFFKETSFVDQSIPGVTFTYSTHNTELTLQRLDVVVSPDTTLNDQVKSIYLEKVINVADTTFVKKFYWKTNRYFRIITSKQTSGYPAMFSEVKVAWGSAD